MLLYVNGDSHSAGHDAGGIEFSYGKHIATALNAELVCHALAAGSNDRIVRTTLKYLETNTPDVVIIGWSTPEREEWVVDGQVLNISAGIDPLMLPVAIRERYKEWVIENADRDVQRAKEIKWHQDAWALHNILKTRAIPHLFFNCYSYFHYIKHWDLPRYNWGDAYVEPYDQDYAYYFWLQARGFKPSNPEYFHYGPDAHVAWAEFLLQRIKI